MIDESGGMAGQTFETALGADIRLDYLQFLHYKITVLAYLCTGVSPVMDTGQLDL